MMKYKKTLTLLTSFTLEYKLSLRVTFSKENPKRKDKKRVKKESKRRRRKKG